MCTLLLLCNFVLDVLFSVISQQQKNGVSWSRSPSSWEVTWSTLTWWKVWILLCFRRWVNKAGRTSLHSIHSFDRPMTDLYRTIYDLFTALVPSILPILKSKTVFLLFNQSSNWQYLRYIWWAFVAFVCHVTHLLCSVVFQVRAEITSKEKEEEDMMEKVQKEAK